MMKTAKTWIVLANARTAKFFSYTGPGKKLEPAGKEVLHADPPKPYTDRAGAVHSSVGPGVSAVEQTDPKALAEAEFVSSLCAYLHKSFIDKAFERLVIAAGPHTLGEIRRALPEDLSKRVMAEINKDLTQVTLNELPDHLSGVIAV
jgi:protein required for attachment to host cells